MSTTIKVQPNQTMMDVVLQACGSLEAGMQFCVDNNVSLSDVPVAGTVFVVSDAALALGDANVLKVVAQKRVKFGNLNTNPPVLPAAPGYEVVLYPLMGAGPDASTVGSHPSVVGYWNFRMVGGSLFVSVYGLPVAAYMGDPNTMGYIAGANKVLGHPVLEKDSEAGAVMSDAPTSVGVNWHIPYNSTSSGGPYLYVYSDEFVTGGVNSLELEDLNGNRAICSPVVVLAANDQTIIQTLMGELAVELVGVSGADIVLRVIRNHAAAAQPDFADMTLSWTDEATGGVADPLDPLNANKTIVTLPVGAHKLGVQTVYKYTDGVTVLGMSKMQMVVEVS